jgi:predicted nucleotidyltransferase
MKYGLTAEQVTYLRETVVVPLAAQGAVVYLYGSRARGDHQPFSDIDLMIEGEPIKPAELSRIRESLVEGPLPYKVDLVLISEFADSYRAGYLQDRIRLG